jgi:hypothetical protein
MMQFMKITVVWVAMICNLIDIQRYLGTAYSSHFKVEVCVKDGGIKFPGTLATFVTATETCDMVPLGEDLVWGTRLFLSLITTLAKLS